MIFVEHPRHVTREEAEAWLVQIDCRDLDAAREAVGSGLGIALLADLRLLGMRPSVALVENGS